MSTTIARPGFIPGFPGKTVGAVVLGVILAAGIGYTATQVSEGSAEPSVGFHSNVLEREGGVLGAASQETRFNSNVLEREAGVLGAVANPQAVHAAELPSELAALRAVPGTYTLPSAQGEMALTRALAGENAQMIDWIYDLQGARVNPWTGEIDTNSTDRGQSRRAWIDYMSKKASEPSGGGGGPLRLE